MKKVIVLPRVRGNGHGGSFVGRKGYLKPKHIVELNKISLPKIEIRTAC